MICGRPLSHSCLTPLINTSHQHLNPQTPTSMEERQVKAPHQEEEETLQAGEENRILGKLQVHQKERKRLFRQAEWNVVNNTIQEGLAQNNSKPFWRYIKSKRQDNIGTVPLKFNGTLCSDSKSKANIILLQQFQSVFTKDNSLPPSSDESDPTYSPIPDLKIKRHGVEKLLQKINVSKVVGPDNIPNQVLKECATELAEGPTCIFQRSVDTGLLPEDWGHANITPVFKKGNKHLAENYRPVSLTSVSSKLLEHIIFPTSCPTLTTTKFLAT